MKTLLIKAFEGVASNVLLPRVDSQNIMIRKNIKNGGLLVFQMASNINATLVIAGGMFVNADFSETDNLALSGDGTGVKVRVRLNNDFAFVYVTSGAKIIFKHFPQEMNDFTSPYIDFAKGFTKVWDFRFAFETMKYFNENLNSLDFSECESLMYTFSGAKSFNQPITNFDVSRITNMIGTFNNAESFNQDISIWNFNKQVDLDEFINFSGISVDNYSRLLKKLDSIDFTGRTTPKVLGALGLKYNDEGAIHRGSLVSKGWTITDSGKA